MGSLFGALRSRLMRPIPVLEAPPELTGVRAAWLGGVFVVIFGLTGLLAYAGPLGFAALLAIGGLFGLGLVKQARLPSPMIWPWIAIALWGAVSMAWSPLTKDLSLGALLGAFEKQTALKLVLQTLLYGAFIVAAASLPSVLAKRALTGLTLGLVVVAALILVEGSYGAAIYQRLKLAIGDPIRPDLAVKNVAQATYILALFCWPAALFLANRFAKGLSQWMIGTLFIGLVAAAVQMSADAALAGLAVGLLAYSAVALTGRLAILFLVAATTLYWWQRLSWCFWPSIMVFSLARNPCSGRHGMRASIYGALPPRGSWSTRSSDGGWMRAGPLAIPFPCTLTMEPCRSG